MNVPSTGNNRPFLHLQVKVIDKDLEEEKKQYFKSSKDPFAQYSNIFAGVDSEDWRDLKRENTK